MQGMDWNDLRHVLALARDGSLAAAARRLAVDATTVARRLRAAEAALGVRLFQRMPDVRCDRRRRAKQRRPTPSARRQR
jgi:DNA-binding transcriptional LysR family regulator